MQMKKQEKNSFDMLNLVYGLGGSIVIVGALFKILHWSLGPISGSVLLAIGLLTEAIIFAIGAFERKKEELDWTLAYPELKGEKRLENNSRLGDVNDRLSSKLDKMLNEAKLDVNLLNNLTEGIKSFESVSKVVTPTVEIINGAEKYVGELSKAAKNVNSLNKLYQEHIGVVLKQKELTETISNSTGKLVGEMGSLTNNLSKLNNVYGGMLSAMKR